MTVAKRDKLYNLIQFVTMAYIEPDINEQCRDWKKEQINSPQRGSAYGQEKKNYKFVRLV